MRLLTDSEVREALRMEWRWLDLVTVEAGMELSIVLRECLTEPQRTYAFRWDTYHVYGVRNESFIVMEDRREGEDGPLRELQNTTFLEYANASTWQDGETLRHWQIAASDHVIDIAAAHRPVITLGEGDLIVG